MAVLSSHILNGLDGTHADGVDVKLLISGQSDPILTGQTDAGGRFVQEVDLSRHDAEQSYDLVFETGAYWQKQGFDMPRAYQVVLRFFMPSNDQKYHMPIILNPHSYSTWISK